MPLTLGWVWQGRFLSRISGKEESPPPLRAGGNLPGGGSEALGESHDQRYQLLLSNCPLIGGCGHQCQLAGCELAGGTLCGYPHFTLCGGLSVVGLTLGQPCPRCVLVLCPCEQRPQNVRGLLGSQEPVPNRLPRFRGADRRKAEEESPNDEDSLPARG